MDINVQAFRLVQQAMGESSVEEKRRQAASKRSGQIGGRIRATKLSPEKRREIARKANEARWVDNKSLSAAH